MRAKILNKSFFTIFVLFILLFTSLTINPLTNAEDSSVWMYPDILDFGFVNRGNCKDSSLVIVNDGSSQANVRVSMEVCKDYSDDSDEDDLSQFKLEKTSGYVGGGKQIEIECQYCPQEEIGDRKSVVRVNLKTGGKVVDSCIFLGETTKLPPLNVTLQILNYYYENDEKIDLPQNARNFIAIISGGRPDYEIQFTFGDGTESEPLTTSTKEVSEIHYYSGNDRDYTVKVTVKDKNDEVVSVSRTFHIWYLVDYDYPYKWFPTPEDLRYVEKNPTDGIKLYPPLSSDRYELPPPFLDVPWFTNFWNSGDYNEDIFWNHGIRYRSSYEGEYLCPDEFNFLDARDHKRHGDFIEVCQPTDLVNDPYGFESSPMICQSFKADCNKIGAFGLLMGRNEYSDTGFTIGLYPNIYLNTGEINEEKGGYIYENRPNVLNPIAEYHYNADDIEGANSGINDDTDIWWENKSWLGSTYRDGNDLKRNPDGFVYFSKDDADDKNKVPYPKTIEINPDQTYYIGVTLDDAPEDDHEHGIYLYGTGNIEDLDNYQKGSMGEMDLTEWNEEIPGVRYEERPNQDLCFYVWGWNEPPENPNDYSPHNQTFELIDNGAVLSVNISDPDINEKNLEVSFYGALDVLDEYKKPEDLIKHENLIKTVYVSKNILNLNYPDPTNVRILWSDLQYSQNLQYKWTAVVNDWCLQRINITPNQGQVDYVDSCRVPWFYTCEYTSNKPFVFMVPSVQEISEGELFESINLDECVWDSNDDVSEMVWDYSIINQKGDLGIQIDIDENRVAHITYQGSGAANVKFTATDSQGLSHSDIASFVVIPEHHEPSISIKKYVKKADVGDWNDNLIKSRQEKVVSFRLLIDNFGKENANFLLEDKLPNDLFYLDNSANIEPYLYNGSLFWVFENVNPIDPVIEILFNIKTPKIADKFENSVDLYLSDEKITLPDSDEYKNTLYLEDSDNASVMVLDPSQNKPGEASNPNPANEQEDVSFTPILSCTVIDPEEDVMNVSFYLRERYIGTDYNVESGGIASIQVEEELRFSTDYDWYVIVDDSFITKRSKLWVFKTREAQSDPPNKPIVKFISEGQSDKDIIFSVVSQDPEGDDIYYLWNFSDATEIGWLGPFPSGEERTITHRFGEGNKFEIKVKAKDIYNKESEWSDPVKINFVTSRSKIKALFDRLFKLFPNFYILFQKLSIYFI